MGWMARDVFGWHCSSPSFLGSITRNDAGLPLSVGRVWQGFRWGKNVFRLYFINEKLSRPFLTIGERDGVDSGGAHWMTCPIKKTCHPSLCLGPLSLGTFFHSKIWIFK